MSDRKKIIIFASGSGSNAEQIIRYFSNNPHIHVAAVCCNNPRAGVIERAEKYHIPVYIFDRRALYGTDEVSNFLKRINPSLIVLAGFLWKIPQDIIEAFPSRIINLHPALLPKFGGAGMYGPNVQKAVLQAGERETGITIHYIDADYDRGKIIFQERCPVKPEDTPESLAKRIHALEHHFLPRIIEKLLSKPASDV